MPEDRVEVGRKFKVGDYEGYIHVGLFEDGTPGDIFVDIAKEGTTLAGLLASDELATTTRRCHRLLERGVFPAPASSAYPVIPWPPF